MSPRLLRFTLRWSGGAYPWTRLQTFTPVNRRTDDVAVSNTAMGVLLLVTGAVSGALAQVGVEIALGFLALLGIVGVLVAEALPEVTRPG